MKSTRGAYWAEPNPRPAQPTLLDFGDAARLDEVECPPGTQTISMETGQLAVL